MNTIVDEVLGHIRLVRDDKEKLQKILDFILAEIYEEPEEELLEIPEKVEELLPQIAGSIDAGFICYINPDTLEIKEIRNNLFEDEMITGGSLEDEKYKFQTWDKYYEIELHEAHDSFKIMKAFAEDIADKKFSEQLFYALNHRKPFTNFKLKIDNSPYRQNWFDFKQHWIEGYVREIIWRELNKMDEI